MLESILREWLMSNGYTFYHVKPLRNSDLSTYAPGHFLVGPFRKGEVDSRNQITPRIEIDLRSANLSRNPDQLYCYHNGIYGAWHGLGIIDISDPNSFSQLESYIDHYMLIGCTNDCPESSDVWKG